MLLKNTLRKLKHSFGRYMSLLIIVLIGIGFYAGIQSSVPSIKNLQNDYYNETNLMDLTVRSTLGLTENDLSAIKQLPNIKQAEGSFTTTVLTGEDAIKVHAITENVNKYKLEKGRIPQNENECLADSSFYKVGDTIEITSEDTCSAVKPSKAALI